MSVGAQAPPLHLEAKSKSRKEVDYDEEGDFEVDAADHSVGDYGSTHGTGSNLVHGNVEISRLRSR